MWIFFSAINAKQSILNKVDEAHDIHTQGRQKWIFFVFFCATFNIKR